MSRIRRWLAPTVAAVAVTAAGVLLVPTATAAPTEAAAVPCDTTSAAYSYVVLYNPHTPQVAVDKELGAKCGTKVAYYPEIGVAVATSRNADFAGLIGVYRAYSGDREVAIPPTAGAAGQRAASQRAAAATQRQLEETTEVVAADDLSAQQWDMRAIHAPEANKVNEGSKAVTVGVLDSGIDAAHPALTAAVDAKCRHHRGQGHRPWLHRDRSRSEAGLGEGGQRRGLHLPRGRCLRIHVGRAASVPGDQQQLLHRPGHVLLPEAAG
jgi:subtilisin family serine protease